MNDGCQNRQLQRLERDQEGRNKNLTLRSICALSRKL
jgi:hypothetical protein